MVTSWEEITSKQGNKVRRKSADYDARRVSRVARGCGRKESEVKELLYKFATMRQMMVQLGASTGLLGKIPGFKQFAQMKKLASMDLGAVTGAPGGPGGGGAMMAPGAASVPGLPKGYTMPGTKSHAPPPVRSSDRAKDKKKRKDARKQRKKSRKR